MMGQGSSQVFGLSTWMMEFPFVELEKTTDGGGSFCVFLVPVAGGQGQPFFGFWHIRLEAWLGTLGEIRGCGRRQ